MKVANLALAELLLLSTIKPWQTVLGQGAHQKACHVLGIRQHEEKPGG